MKDSIMKSLVYDFKWFYKEALQKVNGSTFYINNIRRKYIHSIRVLTIGNKIRNKTALLSNNTTSELEDIAIKALLFHDVGRFEEAVERYKQEENNEFSPVWDRKLNHGMIGVNILKNNPKYNDKRILFAIKFHGEMIEKALNSKEYKEEKDKKVKQEMLHILYLVRDADKLENLYRIKNHNNLQKDVFYKQLAEENKTASLTDKVIKQFLAKKVIKFSSVKTYADRLLMVLSWYFDINYKESIKISKEKQYKKYLLGELEKYNQDKNLQLKIKNMLNKY